MTYVVTQNPQEFFDQSVAKLLAQGTASTNGDYCLYRSTTTKGRKVACIFGLMLPDEEYKEEFEENVVPDLIEKGFVSFKKYTTQELAIELQMIVHDPNHKYSGQVFRYRVLRDAKSVADNFELDFNFIEKEANKYGL